MDSSDAMRNYAAHGSLTRSGRIFLGVVNLWRSRFLLLGALLTYLLKDAVSSQNLRGVYSHLQGTEGWVVCSVVTGSATFCSPWRQARNFVVEHQAIEFLDFTREGRSADSRRRRSFFANGAPKQSIYCCKPRQRTKRGSAARCAIREVKEEAGVWAW